MLSDDTKDTIQSKTMVWEESQADSRIEYITNLTDTERTAWELETDTVAVVKVSSEYTGVAWYEWTATELAEFLANDESAVCQCFDDFDDTDDPEMTDPNCPTYHNNW